MSVTDYELFHSERRCRACGCTDLRACRGGCFWVEDDLCSTCYSVQREWSRACIIGTLGGVALGAMLSAAAFWTWG